MAFTVPGADSKGTLTNIVSSPPTPTSPGAKAKTTEVTWHESPITTTNWNKHFPYQLIVVTKEGDQYSRRSDWSNRPMVYTLPIPPESLSLQMPFAIQTWITMGGSIEEHNGAPLRMISLHGSFGVRGEQVNGAAPSRPNWAGAIFAGTVRAAKNIGKDFTKAIGTFKFDLNVDPESAWTADSPSPGDIETQAHRTGFYQWRSLQTFFERYATLKLTDRKARLAFAMWKDEAVYLVQPVHFNVSKSAQSPIEYIYDLQFKATKRVILEQGGPGEYKPRLTIMQRPNDLARLLNEIRAVRKVLQDAKKTIEAVGADIAASLFEVIRELILMAKDAMAIPIAAADLPKRILQDANRAIADAAALVFDVRNYGNALKGAGRGVGAAGNELGATFRHFIAVSSDSSAGFEKRGQDPDITQEGYEELLDKIQVGDLLLTATVVGKIADERQRVANLSQEYWKGRRDLFFNAATDYASRIGLGSATFDRTYGNALRSLSVAHTPTDEDYDILFASNRLAMALDKFVITNIREPRAKLDAIASVAGFAARSGIAFKIPRSKYAVPFPYGSTLEMLAARYLGDVNRWHEIAVLNGLQTPFVDEEGFQLSLLVNGAGNTVVVPDASHLFTGQPVWLESKATPREQRTITGIEKLASNRVFVSLDGATDLQKYTTYASAKLHAFLPNTVNSQQLIFIPADQDPPEQDFASKMLPKVFDYHHLLHVGGIDLLLTPSNDLVVTPDGASRWSVGMTNIIQRIRLAVSTRQGTYLQHPTYGLPFGVGDSIADVSAEATAKAIPAMFRNDPSISAVKAVKVEMGDGAAKIGIAFEVRGTDRVIPVTVEITR